MDNLVVSQDRSNLLSEVTVTGTKCRVFRDKMMGRLDSLAKVDLNKAWVCKCHPMYLNDYLNGYTHHPKGNYEGERLKPGVGQSYRLIKYSPVGVVEDIQESLNYQGVLYSDEELLKMNNLYRVKGYYGKREFYQPDELEMQSPIPDVRTVLFWTSDIITDEQGKAEVEFFCSDINTGFVGVIEGTDGVGNIGSAGCEFRVMKY